MSSFTRYRPGGLPSLAVLLLALALPLSLVLTGCELEESPSSSITPDQFFSTPAEFEAALAPVYAQLRATLHNDLADYQELQTHSSDEVMVPTRGGDWDDGGQWRQLTQHTWDTRHTIIGDAWTNGFTGVARANSVLASLNNSETQLEQAEAFEAELRFLRAYFYYQLMDLFGNIPIVVEEGGEYPVDYETQPVSSANPPMQRARQEVYDFILRELTGCTSDQLTDGNAQIDACITNSSGAIGNLLDANSATYGRANRAAGYALVARILLNGEVYTGEVGDNNLTSGDEFYEASLAAAEVVLSSSNFMLADNYFDNFSVQNSTSPENIFVAAFKATDPLGMTAHMRVMHYNQLGNTTPWNGFTTIAEFYNSFDVEAGPDGEIGTRDDVINDDRANQFMRGQQYSQPVDGCYGAQCYSDESTEALEDRNGNPLEFTADIPAIDLSGSPLIETAGLRPLKFEVDPDRSGPQNQWGGNDFPIIRLAEVMLIKAEALNELDRTGEVKAVIDDLRDRANADPFPSTTDSDEVRRLILQERGYELHYEAHRRQDLIRYEFQGGSPSGAPYTTSTDPYAPTFTSPWLFKQESDAYRALFPIPQSQIDANPNLEQNTGY